MGRVPEVAAVTRCPVPRSPAPIGCGPRGPSNILRKLRGDQAVVSREGSLIL
jgi:hypothetical protein